MVGMQCTGHVPCDGAVLFSLALVDSSPLHTLASIHLLPRLTPA
jgi:hypothetical protein